MTDPRKTTRWQFIGVITMSVGLGVILLTAFENALRGSSYVWFLVLAVLFIGVISVNFSAIMHRIR